MVMIGNGQVGAQPVSAASQLPQSSGIASTNPPKTSGSGSGGSGSGGSGSGSGNGKGGNSSSGAVGKMGGIVLGVMGMVLGGLMMI